jgi:ArsR family transcriptional regulator, arsenate/arsenite/antimonite-responsive transcriptional repressor
VSVITRNGTTMAAGLPESTPNPAPLPEEVSKDLVGLFKLLSDETRLRILHFLLQEEELHVRALCELLGQSQPAVSHHLALLRVAGVIASRRDGKHNFYRLINQRFEDVLDLAFAAVPHQDRRVRFENYVLSYSPPVETKA